MRADMFKVIVERPRHRVDYYRNLPNEYRSAKRFKIDECDDVSDEFCGVKLPMRSKRVGWLGKELNENLNPLRRFLNKQIGRPWNDVYSEICDGLDTGSTVKQHVRQHISDFVSTKTFYNDNGDLRCATRWGIKHYLYNDLYVDPDGILRGRDTPKVNNYKVYRKTRAAEKDRIEREVDNLHSYVKFNDLWFFVTYEPLLPGWSKTTSLGKLDALGRAYDDVYRYRLVTDRKVAISKRSASHREIMKYKLLEG